MKKLMSILLAAALLLCVTACGSNLPGGRYDIESLETGGISITGAQLKSLGTEVYIVFNDDGTGAIGFTSDNETETGHFTWQENQISTDDGETVQFTFDGGSVTIEKDGTKLVFK